MLAALGERRAFHRAYRRATQHAHELALAYFGGVFRTLRYDNLSSAVKRILRGARREETARFVTFRSHWRFASEFCTPGKGNEKGGVEGEVRRYRRNHWVPLPPRRWTSSTASCSKAAAKTKRARFGEGMLIDAAEGFEIEVSSFPGSTGCACRSAPRSARRSSRCSRPALPRQRERWRARRRWNNGAKPGVSTPKLIDRGIGELARDWAVAAAVGQRARLARGLAGRCSRLD